MLEKKKNALIIVGLLITCFAVVGVSYAVWSLTLTQTEKNVVTTGCFKVEFTDQNPLTLDKAYPITDEEGKSLTPYEFTLTNTCDSEATYYVNLETITSATKKLSEEYLKASLKKGETEVFLNTLNSSYINLDKVLPEASNAYKLYQGVLKSKETATFHLNLWLDENTPTSDEVMNATYEGKITVSTSYKAPEKNLMIAMGYEEYDEGSQGRLVNTLYTQDSKYFVTKVVYQNKIKPYEEAEEVVDFSVAKDKSVLGYYVKNADYDYTLYIQANGKIKVNPDASGLGFIESTCRDGCTTSNNIIEGLENLDTSLVTDMSYMFSHTGNTSLDLSHFDTSNVTDMSYMFYSDYGIADGENKILNLNLDGFDTSKVVNMQGMFRAVDSLTDLDLSSFKTANVTDMSSMFWGMTSLQNLDITNFDTKNVTDMGLMFAGISNLTNLDLSHFNTSKVTNMHAMFSDMSNLKSLNISSFDTRNVKDMRWMFSDMDNLTELDLSHFDTGNVTNMSGMFYGMTNLTALDISNFNTSNVTDMSYMFTVLNNVTNLDISSFNTTNVKNMSYMFSGMSSLTSLNISNFDTQNVTDMSRMFVDLNNVTNFDISGFNTQNVTDMRDMFYNMNSLTNLNLSHFNTEKVKHMEGMFYGMSNLTQLDISHFNTQNVWYFGNDINNTHLEGMFQNTPKLTNIIYSNEFVHNEIATVGDMYTNCSANKPTHESWNGVKF